MDFIVPDHSFIISKKNEMLFQTQDNRVWCLFNTSKLNPAARFSQHPSSPICLPFPPLWTLQLKGWVALSPEAPLCIIQTFWLQCKHGQITTISHATISLSFHGGGQIYEFFKFLYDRKISGLFITNLGIILSLCSFSPFSNHPLLADKPWWHIHIHPWRC